MLDRFKSLEAKTTRRGTRLSKFPNLVGSMPIATLTTIDESLERVDFVGVMYKFISNTHKVINNRDRSIVVRSTNVRT